MASGTLGLKYIIWGLVFLANPNINVIDIMPDFIGYLFIIKGLYGVSAIYPHFRDASGHFKKLTLISVLKCLSLPVLILISSSEITWLLVLAFVFGCFEIFYSWMAFSKLFEGIYYSAERGAGKKVFEGYETIRLFTVIFVIVKPIASFLPELTTLSSTEYGTVTESGIVSYARFRIPIMIGIIIISLIVGIVWYVMARKYFKNLLADNEYISSLEEKYTVYSTENPHLVDRRILVSAIGFIGAAAFLALEVKLDGINIIPNFAAGGFLIAAFIRVRKTFPRLAKAGIAVSSLYTLMSAVNFGFSIFFTSKYIVIDANSIGMTVGYGRQIATYLGTNAEISRIFNTMCVLYIIENILLVACIFLSASLLRGTLIRHGGKPIYELGQVHDMKVILRSTALERMWIIIVCAVGILSALLASLQFVFVTTDYNFWVIDIAVRIVWLIMVLYTCEKIKDSTREKYIFVKAEGIS